MSADSGREGSAPELERLPPWSGGCWDFFLQKAQLFRLLALVTGLKILGFTHNVKYLVGNSNQTVKDVCDKNFNL